MSGSTGFPFVTGEMPTATQWNNLFAQFALAVAGVLDSPTLNAPIFSTVISPTPINFIINGTPVPFPGPAGPYLSLGGGTLAGNLTANGVVLIGTGTPGNTNHYGFQTAFDADPSALGGNARQNIFNTTLNYSGSTSNIWENLNSFLAVNGPGVANGEINLAHTYLQVNAGGDAQVVEGYESSALNNGVVGQYASYLAIFQNGNSGTVNEMSGFLTYLTNDNTSPGAIGEWDAFSVGPMQGGGSYPTFYNAMRVGDPKAGIVTVGGIRIGNLSNAVSGQLTINGNDNSSGTFPFVFTNLAGNVFAFDNAGNANFQAAGIVIGPSTGGLFSINAPDTSNSHFSMSVRNSANTILFNLSNAGSVTFPVAGVTLSASTGGLVSIAAPDNTSGHFSLSVSNAASNVLLNVDNSGIVGFPEAGISISSSTGGLLSIGAPDNTANHFALSIKNQANDVLFNLDNSGVAHFGVAGVLISPSTGGIISVSAPDNTAGHYSLVLKNAANTTLLSVDNSGVIQTDSFTANGSVATALSSLGPVGAHTTVQTWLTVTDSTGAVRYIPCF